MSFYFPRTRTRAKNSESFFQLQFIRKSKLFCANVNITQIKPHTLSTTVFQHRMIASRPTEYSRPVCLSNWSAFTPDRCRGSSSSRITNEIVTFLLGMAWLWGWPCEWPEGGRIPAAILHLFLSQQQFRFQFSDSYNPSAEYPLRQESLQNRCFQSVRSW